MTNVIPDQINSELSSEQLGQLLDISARLSSTLHLDELLAMVMEAATELTQTEAASILLLDEDNEQLRFVASTDNLMPEDIVVPLNQSIAGWVVQNGRHLIVNDVQTDERFFPSVDHSTQFQTQTMLAIPLQTPEKVIGTLEVINKKNGLSYTSQDVALMEALASQAAVAIVNARLFEQFDLLAEIMHELKTPMMAVYSAAELLSRPDFPDERRQILVEMIKRESRRLSKMTRDFLDLARLESRRTRLERQPVALATLVEEVVVITRPQAAERNICIETSFAPDVPPAGHYTLWGDPDRLKQVLLNLVSNGIKYNRENGRIAICAHCENSCLYLTVADTGPGIEAQDIEHLFDRFYRLPGSEDLAEGSGLGLAIAYKIVVQHQGEIAVDSTLGKGTAFTVQLPLTPS